MLIALLQSCSFFAPSGPSGTVLAIQEEDGKARSVLIDVTSGARTPLDLGDGVYPGPADPQGTHLLVVATEEGPQGHRETLQMVPRSGGAAIDLAPPAQMVRSPTFSPDGSFLVFESSIDSFRDLYRVQRDGSGLQRLTDNPEGNFEPRISHDGTRILFASSRDGNAEIYVMNVDGSEPTRLTESREDDTSPGWLPDGSILWLHQMQSSKLVWRMDADGGHPHVLRRRDGPTLDHGWVASPDGATVAITMQSGPRELDLVLFDMATKAETVLGGEGVDEMPTFSPDGAWLAWTSNQSGDPEIWVARADGTDARVLAARPGPDWLPRWLPN